MSPSKAVEALKILTENNFLRFYAISEAIEIRVTEDLRVKSMADTQISMALIMKYIAEGNLEAACSLLRSEQALIESVLKKECAA